MPPKRYTLLIADDDRLLRETMRMSLRNTFDVVLATDGKEAVDAFARQKIDAVLLDGAMPNMTGYEACAAIRNMPGGEQLPVCIATSSENESMVDRAFEAGATDFCQKPADLGLMGRKIVHLIERAQAPAKGASAATNCESALFKAFPDPALLLDKDRRIVCGNPAFHQMLPEFRGMEGKELTALFAEQELNLDAFRRKVRLQLDTEQFVMARLVEVSPERSLLRVDPFSEAVPVAKANAPVTPLRILLLEDQELVSRSVMRLLERAGHNVKLVERGDEAVSEFSRADKADAPYDLVMLDLSIPGSNGGAEVLQSLRKVTPGILAIATSGSWEDPVMRHPTRYGFNAVLPKPFNREDLLGVIASVMEGR